MGDVDRLSELAMRLMVDLSKLYETLPKQHKYILGDKLINRGVDVIDICVAIRKKRHKKTDITKLDIYIESTRDLIIVLRATTNVNREIKSNILVGLKEMGAIVGYLIKTNLQ